MSTLPMIPDDFRETVEQLKRAMQSLVGGNSEPSKALASLARMSPPLAPWASTNAAPMKPGRTSILSRPAFAAAS
jgi:hypothetical protein